MKLYWPFRRSNQTRTPRAVPLTLVVVFIFVALLIGIGAGYLVRGNRLVGGHITNINQPIPGYLAKDVDFSLFWKVWDHLHQNSLERPLVDTKLFYGALSGMVAGLNDPYSVFMDPETAKSFGDELQGTFDGIGAEIGIRDKQLVIIAPLPGTPAEKAGLRAGDKVLGINKFDTAGMAVDYAVTLIRGPRGTKVTLTVLSGGESDPRQVEITRNRIVVKPARGELKALPTGGKAAYIRLTQFSKDINQEFQTVWQDLAASGPKGIIIDLRNNPGGYLDQAVDVASHWVGGSKVVVKEQLVPPQFNEYQSTGKAELANIPTVVLVNQGSASASEILTGALQDWHLATVVGEQTFGKGSVQSLEDFPDGSAVKLTIAKWFTPNGRSIDKNGLKPDIEVKMTREDSDKGRDPQLDRALELLSR